MHCGPEPLGPARMKSWSRPKAPCDQRDANWRPRVEATAHRCGVAFGTPLEVAFTDGRRMVRVYDKDGVTIDATLVAHDPVAPALGLGTTTASRANAR